MTGMTVSQIDKYFTKNNKNLRSIAVNFTKRYKTNFPSDELISQAYLHVTSIAHRINNTDQLQSYVINNMRLEAKYTKSTLNQYYTSREILTDDCFYITNDQDNTFIEREKLLNELTVLIRVYMLRNKDKAKQRILEAYLNDDCTTVRSLANKFNINTTAAFRIKREIIEELKNFRILQKKDNVQI